MSTQGTIRRYTLIVEKVTEAHYPSFQDLKDYLDAHGFEISPRTLQRNIEQIRNEFGVEIKYDRNKNGYYVDKDVSQNLDSFLRFLEIVGTGNLIYESLKDGSNTLNHISFESQGALKGIEQLKSLLSAIKDHRVVTFIHTSFFSDKGKSFKAYPYLLKEYQNRWYLVALIEGGDNFWTFGIDRISELKVLAKTFNPDTSINPSLRFENIVGLNYSDNDLEEVILSLTPIQAKYLKALPLHKSQVVIKETKKEVQFKLTVIPNYELVQKIMMMLDQVKVLSPKWLADDVKKTLRTTLKQYK